MNNKSVRDMTSGNIVVHLLAFALPLLAGNVFQQFYNIVDSIIVGRYVGATALGAVGSVGSLVFLFVSLCIGLGSGVGILVSQLFGAGDKESVKTYIAHSIYVVGAAGILMSVLGFFLAKPILSVMNTPAETFNDALTYMRIVCGFTFAVAAYNCISAILRALGDSKTPLIFLVVASVINVILDFVFVLGFNMGVAGAAYATVVSQIISAIGSILWGIRINPYLRLERHHYDLDMEIVARQIKVGVPLALQSATISISCVILQSVVNSFGATVMAAYTATNRVEQLVQQPFNSLCLALSTFAGQNYGAGKMDRIKQAARNGLVINAIFSALMVLVMFVFGHQIVGIFISDAAVIEIGAEGLKFTSLAYFVLGLIYVSRGLLNGVGDVFYSLLNGIAEVVGRIGFVFIMIGIFKLDFMSIWYTNALTWALAGILGWARFMFWRNKYAGNSKSLQEDK